MTDLEVMKPPYPLTCMAAVLYGLSSILDSGNSDDITIEDVKVHARASDLVEFLTRVAGGVLVSGWLDEPSWKEFRAWYAQQIRDNCKAMEGREHKYSIENRGICLLISYTAQMVGQADGSALRYRDPLKSIASIDELLDGD
jgi:hypothetical protein